MKIRIDFHQTDGKFYYRWDGEMNFLDNGVSILDQIRQMNKDRTLRAAWFNGMFVGTWHGPMIVTKLKENADPHADINGLILPD